MLFLVNWKIAGSDALSVNFLHKRLSQLISTVLPGDSFSSNETEHFGLHDTDPVIGVNVVTFADGNDFGVRQVFGRGRGDWVEVGHEERGKADQDLREQVEN